MSNILILNTERFLDYSYRSVFKYIIHNLFILIMIVLLHERSYMIMFFKATKSQIFFLIKKKETIIVFYLLLIMILLNFISNVITFQGKDVTQMYHPMKLLLLSYNRVNYNADATLLLIQLYPLLVVFPAGFSLLKEQQTGQDVLMIARLGHLTYKFSKQLAVFLVTTMVFSIPFLMELLLNCLSFPLKATGDLTNMNSYNPKYINNVHNYLMSSLFINMPYLYAIIGTLLFGVVSGLLAVFTIAFSSVFRIKYRIYLFLPVFLFLHATTYLTDIIPDDIPSIKWYDYLLIFNDKPKNSILLIVTLFIIVFFSLGSPFIYTRKDYMR